MSTRKQRTARSRHLPGLTTAVFFGLLIGVVLVGSQLLSAWWWPARRFDAHVGAVGALFLAAGLAVGLRIRLHGRPHPHGTEPSPAAVPRPAASGPSHPTADSTLVESLTPRELEILASLADGWSNAEIAERHFVSVNTVKTHLRQIYGKLQVTRRVQAVTRARELGLLS